MITKKIKIDQLHFQVTSDDTYLSSIGEDFEPHMVKLFNSLITTEAVVFDIGANIGLTTLFFAQKSRQVLSFEPAPTTFNFLNLNVEMSSFKNVKVFNLGLSDSPGKSRITYAANNRAGGFVNSNLNLDSDHISEQISLSTVDRICNEVGLYPDFIKIDVEGFELLVLKGAQHTLTTYKPTVVLEMNAFCLNVLHRIATPTFLEEINALFPFVYAVDSETLEVMNLKDQYKAYKVLHDNAVHQRFQNLVCTFDNTVEEKLHQITTNQFIAGNKQKSSVLQRTKNFVVKIVRNVSPRP